MQASIRDSTAIGGVPIFGPQAKAAVRLPVEGRKRRKLLVLLAAYADAGVPDPSLRQLGARVGLKWRTVDQLAMRLERDGYITVVRCRGQRNVYSLLCLHQQV